MSGPTYSIRSAVRPLGERFAAVATDGKRTLRAEADISEAAEAARRALVAALRPAGRGNH